MIKRVMAFIMIMGMMFSLAACKTRNVIETNGTAVVDKLKLNYLAEPTGVSVNSQLFSWQMNDTARGQKQTAYEITVATSESKLLLGDYNVWKSGKIESEESVCVPYTGDALTPATKYYWQVQVWDKNGKSTVSAPASFVTALADDGFCDCNWILQDKSSGSTSGAPIMRKTFKLTQSSRNITSAYVFATCAGLYELSVNGDKQSDNVLTPGAMQFDQTVYYQTYDITAALTAGENVLSAQLGNGWWCGAVGLVFYKSLPAFIAKAVITYNDGSVQTITTDGSWEYTLNGPVIKNDIYNGETYVSSRADSRNYKYSPVRTATSAELDLGKLVPQPGAQVKPVATFNAVAITEPTTGVYIYDFGQNMAGVAEITVKTDKKQTVQIRYGEELNGSQHNADGAEGTLYTANLRHAQATDNFVTAGTGEETWRATFTYHGFRYAEISGIDKSDIINVKAVAYSSDMDITASFETSNSKVNQLFSNSYWGMRSNFVSTATDCPSRDERFGYLGDAEVFCGTSNYLCDAATFYNKYINDILDCTQLNGAFPNSAPGAYKTQGQQAHGGWADGGIIIPYEAYIAYGDITMLEKCYPYMQQYIDYMKAEAGADYIRDNMGEYGDWLNYNDSTPVGACDTAYCVYTTALMAKIATILNKPDDAITYSALCSNYKNAWVKEYMNADGSTKCASQTSYVLALAFDICPKELRAAAAANLVTKIRQKSNHLTCGFLGIRYLLPVLCDCGYTDVAYDLLVSEGCPSWFYMIDNGATTIWERWNAITTQNTYNDTGMNSFNHFAFGCVSEWMISYMGGIKKDENSVAYKHFILQPKLNSKFDHVTAEYDSYYGKIISSWNTSGNILTYTCVVPANTTATLYLPTVNAEGVTESGNSIFNAEGVAIVGTIDGTLKLELASGSYSFVSAI